MGLKVLFILNILLFVACGNTDVKKGAPAAKTAENGLVKHPSLLILGTVQDAGSPQIGCKKECCESLFLNPAPSRKVVSLALIDPQFNKTYLFEATPDIPEQLKILKNRAGNPRELPDGIFLTHAHIGHYTGLMYLGKEAANADRIPVYAMPQIGGFLEQNGPWSQLVANGNISLMPLKPSDTVQLTPNFSVIPFIVPHRDEYSETVGYKIHGPEKSALFIPDIDKWERWDVNIVEEIAKVDLAFLDATFYDAEEINNRDISQIPHPFVVESINLFQSLPPAEKAKIHFIHFNHTNPLLNSESRQSKEVQDQGYKIAAFQDIFAL